MKQKWTKFETEDPPDGLPVMIEYLDTEDGEAICRTICECWNGEAYGIIQDEIALVRWKRLPEEIYEELNES